MTFNLKKSGLPRKLLVGPFEHTVAFKGLSHGSDRTIFGMYTFEDLEFAFEEDQANESFAADTVLHEVLHAIWKIAALNHEKTPTADAEEKVVTLLATGLVQLFRANPKFAEWLLTRAS